MQKLPFCLVLLILLTGCTPAAKNTVSSAGPDTLVWYLPAYEKYKDTQAVTAEINGIIQQIYPSIQVDFRFVNIYEYTEKVSLYLSSGEQMDIVWANDKMLPFIQYPYNNIYKFLDAPIQSNAPALYGRLKTEDDSAYRIFDKNYFIPMIDKNSGLIPFLKIPRELAAYMDIQNFTEIVQANDTASPALFACIDEYLQNLSTAGRLQDGVDLARIYDIFPQIGYETYISTNNLIGRRISDPDGAALDMLNTESTRLSYRMFESWLAQRFIRDDTPIIYKSHSDSPYRYVLSGTWGYVDDNSLSVLMDQDTEDYIYLAADRYYHKTKLFTDSVALIPTRSKYLDKALKILDLFYQDSRLYNLLTFGNENTQNEYRNFENIVPGNKTTDKTISRSDVYMGQMLEGTSYPGMYVPAVSTLFRRTLLDYTNTYTLPPYSTVLPDNSASAIEYLLQVYNGEITDEN